MGCQHKMAQSILKKKADYLLAIKGNQGKLTGAFDERYSTSMWLDENYDSYSTQEKGRLAAIEHMVVRYYISSAKLTLQELLEATRAPWSIENQLHWRFDVS